MGKGEKKYLKKVKKSKLPTIVDIGIRLPISDEGLEWIEKHDPELAELIREENPRFRK